MTEKTPEKSKFFRDPVFYFLVIGAIIYGGFYLLEDASDAQLSDKKTIVVTQGEIAWLSAQWESRWKRPPTEQELEGMIASHVREMVLYREALALGLDKEDVVIRRRLGQKLEFLSADLLEPAPPSDEELKVYFSENIDKYRGDDIATMTHIFFDPDVRGNATLDDANAMLESLESTPDAPRDVSALGDRFLLQSYYPDVTERELARQFGGGFAEPVFELQPGKWHGPVLSGYGTHLVYIHSHVAAPDPLFEAFAPRVLDDWIDSERKDLNAAFTEQLIAQYKIDIQRDLAEEQAEPKVLN